MNNHGKVMPVAFAVIIFFLTVVGAFEIFAGDITATGMYQKDLHTFLSNVVTMANEIKSDANTNRSLGRTVCLDFADIDINTVNGKYFETNNTVDYVIDNVLYQKAAVITGEFTAGHTALANNQRCKFLITLNSAGTMSTEQGTVVASTADASLPAIPSGGCPIGYIQVTTGSAVFTPGTTDLGASNVTDVYVELMNVDSGSSDSSATSTTDLTLSDL